MDQNRELAVLVLFMGAETPAVEDQGKHSAMLRAAAAGPTACPARSP